MPADPDLEAEPAAELGDIAGELHLLVLARAQLVRRAQAPPPGVVLRAVRRETPQDELTIWRLHRSKERVHAAQQRAWRLVKYAPLRAFALQEQVDLNGLEPLIGLEPSVEQAGHQLVFNW